jgi:adenylate kinase/ribonuclease R
MEFQFAFGNPTKKKGANMRSAKRAIGRKSKATKAKAKGRRNVSSKTAASVKKGAFKPSKRISSMLKVNPIKWVYQKTGAGKGPKLKFGKAGATVGEMKALKGGAATFKKKVGPRIQAAKKRLLSEKKKRESEIKSLQKKIAASKSARTKAMLKKKLASSKIDLNSHNLRWAKYKEAEKKFNTLQAKAKQAENDVKSFGKEADKMAAQGYVPYKSLGKDISETLQKEAKALEKALSGSKKGGKKVAKKKTTRKKASKKKASKKRATKKKSSKKKSKKKVTSKRKTKKKVSKKRRTKKRVTKKRKTKRKASKKRKSTKKRKTKKRKTTKKRKVSKKRKTKRKVSKKRKTKRKVSKKRKTKKRKSKKRKTKKKAKSRKAYKRVKAAKSYLAKLLSPPKGRKTKKGKVRGLKKGRTKKFGIKSGGRKNKRKYNVSVKRTNPVGGTMGKFGKLFEDYAKYTPMEAVGLGVGGGLHGLTNDMVLRRFPRIGEMLSALPGAKYYASSVVPLLAGIAANVVNKRFVKNAQLDLLAKGLIGSSVVGMGASSYNALFMSQAGMSGVDYTPMNGVDYTPLPMNGVDFTPLGESPLGQEESHADFGGVDFTPLGTNESPADFGAEESAADFGFEEGAADFGEYEDDMSEY